MSKKTLNHTNLVALGADQLAALLLEVSTGSADIKRRLRLELSHNLGPSELARDVRKRLATLRRSSSYIGWRKRKAFIADISTQLTMIVDKIAPTDPATGFDLLWDFIGIAPSVYERVDDSRGDVGDVFRAATTSFEQIAPQAKLDPDLLADRVWRVIQENDYGEWDHIITILAQTLGASGLARLKDHVKQYTPPQATDEDHDHEAIQFLRVLHGGDSYLADHKSRFIKSHLQEIAMAANDTSAYIAQYSEQDLKRKDIAAEVAQLLLNDTRAADALDLLLDADQDGRDFGQPAWDSAYIATLTALDRQEDAQTHHWDCFCTTLDPDHLRSYLKALPDFEDVEAEDRAKQVVLHFADFSTALQFCITWPDLVTAAQLIQSRADEINGNYYELLTPAADALRTRHPLAAVLLWRAMIDFALGQGRASRYGHAADHLADCAAVDPQIADYGDIPPHLTYLHHLNSQHDRKSSFWAKVR